MYLGSEEGPSLVREVTPRNRRWWWLQEIAQIFPSRDMEDRRTDDGSCYRPWTCLTARNHTTRTSPNDSVAACFPGVPWSALCGSAVAVCVRSVVEMRGVKGQTGLEIARLMFILPVYPAYAIYQIMGFRQCHDHPKLWYGWFIRRRMNRQAGCTVGDCLGQLAGAGRGQPRAAPAARSWLRGRGSLKPRPNGAGFNITRQRLVHSRQLWFCATWRHWP